MNMFESKNTLYRRLFLLSILIAILIYSFTGEKLPYNNGLGWDGEDYFDILQNFSNLYFNHGINAYHIQRILPFAIIHYIFLLLGIEITTQSAITGMCILNFTCIMLTVVYFFKISKKCNWNPKTETIAFAICFFNVPILKVFGYYPLLTDCPAYLLSYMTMYYYLTNNKVMEVIVGIMALVTWPILAFVIWILAFFPRTEVKILEDNDKLSKLFYNLVRVVFTLWLPLLFFAINGAFSYLHPEIPFMERYNHRHPFNFFHATICILAGAYFFYRAAKAFRLEWLYVLKSIFEKHNFIIIASSLIGFIILYSLSKWYGGENSFSMVGQIVALPEYAMSDIYIFLETHFLYLGLFFLVLLLSWKEFVSEACTKFGIGFLMVVLLALVFVTEIETRKLTSFYPVFLIPLAAIINRKGINNWVPIVYVIISLVLSFFWWHINVEGIEESFIARIDNYRAFPAQRYFMFMGPWQCREVYLIISIIEIVFGLIIYYLHKKKLIYEK